MKSIDKIRAYEQGDVSILKNNPWLMYLCLTEKQNVNYENLYSMVELSDNMLLKYVKRTLEILDEYELEGEIYDAIHDTLIWSEVSKGGLKCQRDKWQKKGYNLFVHNIGSSAIYEHEMGKSYSKVIKELIYTHGLIGQYIRGEVPLSHSESLLSLVDEKLIDITKLKKILLVLNHCIIGGVDKSLWLRIEDEVIRAIEQLMSKGKISRTIEDRLKLLRQVAATNGENFDERFNEVKSLFIKKKVNLNNMLEELLNHREIWYFEAALSDFNLEEVIKILLISYVKIGKSDITHISFEKIMKDIYYDYHGEKKVNLYKKRIVEQYLDNLTYEMILNNKILENPHISINTTLHFSCHDTLFVIFEFTKAAQKLIEFCVEAEKASLGYERAIVLLYDYFGLRKDKYDRFHNEEKYLKTMNKSIDYKSVILDYIVGKRVIDIGPGGGALMSLIEENYPDIQVTGIDISSNVIDALNKKKTMEKRKWVVRFGDALNLKEAVDVGSVDTIIFCSIIHELFSYIEYEGSCFNYKVIEKVLQNSFELLPIGGRIIIRDGIMTSPENQKRQIEFSSSEGMNYLEKYAEDFKGRNIQYKVIGHKCVEMLVNDAMEFLYTYTWGEDSYAHEINEQFGYFTPMAYSEFIKKSLGEKANIIVCKHYLQEGYATALESKVKIFDEKWNTCELPDSTCLIVIEKV